jgi:hypothetical protein
MILTIVDVNDLSHTEDTVRLFMKTVIAQFVYDIEPDQDAAGEAERQTENIDKRIEFIPPNISKGCDSVVF